MNVGDTVCILGSALGLHDKDAFKGTVGVVERVLNDEKVCKIWRHKDDAQMYYLQTDVKVIEDKTPPSIHKKNLNFDFEEYELMDADLDIFEDSEFTEEEITSKDLKNSQVKKINEEQQRKEARKKEIESLLECGSLNSLGLW